MTAAGSKAKELRSLEPSGELSVLHDLATRTAVVFYRMSLPDGNYEYVSPGVTWHVELKLQAAVLPVVEADRILIEQTSIGPATRHSHRYDSQP